MSLQAYLPQDRLHALIKGEPLPDRTRGSALTENLRQSLGARQGAEELWNWM